MAKAAGGRVQETVEQHPWLHNWYLKGDYVKVRNRRGRISTVRRVEKCHYCPTLRISHINTLTKAWEVTSRYYKYARNVTIVRLTKSDFVKREFLSTTDLPEDVKRQLAEQ